jgi:DNA repair photolyase
VVRDIDVLQDAANRIELSVNVSLPTLDDRVWRTTEPGTAPPHSRLEAIRRLSSAGIHVNVGIAPILPGLSDRPGLLEEVVREAKAAGARTAWANVVYLQPAVREHFLAALAADWPNEVERYEQLFANRAYVPKSVAEPIRERVRTAARTARVPERQRARRARSGPQQLALSL